MPRVPVYDAPRVTPSAGTTGAFTTPNTPGAGAIAGDQAQQLGRGAAAAGDAVGRIALDMQAQANDVRVLDAVNQAKERLYDLTYNKDGGYTTLKGVGALERPDGKALPDEYAEKFDQATSGIAEGLGNEAQRQAFQRAAGGMRVQLIGDTQRHMSGEFRTYQGSVYDGAASNAARDVALNYTDVGEGGVVERGMRTIDAAVRAKARLLGQSQEFADVEVRKAQSNAHTLAIGAALERNDVAFADGYLKKFAKQMDADDLLRVQGLITKEMDLRLADATAGKVVSQIAPRLFNTDGDRAFNILIGTESNGQQFDKNGKPLTSSAGAIGVAQVMPTTGPEAAKLAGLPWDEDRYRNDPAYNRALGKAYFAEQLRAFDGDLAKAYAAYNAGPGRVRQEVKDAKKRGEPDAWLSNLPAETRAYVAKNMGEYQAGGGQQSMPTIAEVHAQVRAELGPGARPQVLQAALQRSTQQYDDLVKARKAQEDEAVSNAMRAVVANGGRFSDLPPAVRAQVPPKDLDNVMNFAARVAKGDDVTNGALYLKLATQPGYLTGLSENEFYRLRSELSEADFKHFTNERAIKLTGSGANGWGELNTQALTQTLNDRLRTLGIDPSPKDGSDDAARVGTIHRFVRDAVFEAQRQAGKKLTDAETAQAVDRLFATNVTFKNTVLGFETGGRTSQPLLGMKTSEIPSDIRGRLRDDFRRAGVLNPTDSDLLGAYFRVQQARRGGASGGF